MQTNTAVSQESKIINYCSQYKIEDIELHHEFLLSNNVPTDLIKETEIFTMDKQIQEKLESLQKYVPFIDYIVKLNSDKYVKFKDIKKWIVDKRRLPLNDLCKIEQCLITNYKNISILDDKQMPLEISKIFFNGYVNLCSDDEEEGYIEQPKPSIKPKEPIKQVSLKDNNDSDDDVEIISVSYLSKSARKCEEADEEIKSKTDVVYNSKTKSPSPRPTVSKDFDDETHNLLKQVDDILEEDKAKRKSEYFPPNNYHEIHSEDEVELKTEELFQRRPKKRENKVSPSLQRNENPKSHVNNPSIFPDTISLDSSDDEEVSKTRFENSRDKSTVVNKIDSDKKDNEIPKCSVANGDKIQIENLSYDEMFGFIREKVMTLEYHQLQTICKQIDAAAKSTEAPPTTSAKDVDLSKSSLISINRESSPPPPAPHIESLESPDKLLKLFRDILENTIQKTSQAATKPVEDVTTTNTFKNPQSNSVQLMTSQEPQLNFFQNPLMPVPMQPMILPQGISACIPQQPAMYNLRFQQSYPAQTLINPRDPRARSSLYQKSIKIIMEEMAKRNSVMVANQFTGNSPSISVPQQQHCTISTGIAEAMNSGIIQKDYASNAGGSYILNAGKSVEICVENTPDPKTANAGISLEENVTNICASNQIKIAGSKDGARNKSAITYGEYKRRKSEEQQRQREEEKRRQEILNLKKVEEEKNRQECIIQRTTERQMEDQLEADVASPIDKIKQGDKEEKEITISEKSKEGDAEKLAEKKRSELQSILYSTLLPYKDKIQKICSQTKDQIFKNTENHQQSNGSDDTSVAVNKESQQQQAQNTEALDSQAEIEKEKNVKSRKIDKKDQDEMERKNLRMQRLFKEMECTFKGFEYRPNIIGAKRRSSIHARSIISEQLNSTQGSENGTGNDDTLSTEIGKRRSSLSPTQNNSTSAYGNEKKRRLSLHSSVNDDNNVTKANNKITPPKRRSSIHARYAIADMLDSQSSMESCDIFMPSRETSSSASSDDASERKRLSISSFDLDLNETLPAPKSRKISHAILRKQPRVVLRRLTAEEVRKHTNTTRVTIPKDNNRLDVHLVQSGIRPETPTNCLKKSPPKKCNNDSQMTERNTKFCALCSSKPSDLTNHYKRKHKCESYISRLTWPELDELCINTPFAKLVSNTNSRVERFEVVCPFCHEKLTMPFMQLYDHYASHTGEYAFQCAACQFDKPFKADIQSHQFHSKTCRSAQIQILYRYPPNALSIYLYYCTICNFVQLNEANVYKHLREHHDPRNSLAANVQKCILAAISDSHEFNRPEEVANDSNEIENQDNDTNHGLPLPQSVVPKSEVDLMGDDNIPVCNEACTDENLDLEERLREMHEEHPGTSKQSYPQEPMTVIHMTEQTMNAKFELGRVLPKAPSGHVPKVIKMELIDFGEDSLLTPSKPSSISSKSRTRNILSYSNYRQYPSNVNYLGLYKCMAGDCFYSSDNSDEFVKHLEDHQKDSSPDQHLVCPYCIIPKELCQTPHQLVDHIRTQHIHLVYQCSLCCYRSCEASNVQIHQNENHSNQLSNCKICKCSGTAISPDFNYMKENMCESVEKVQCPNCPSSYYNTFCLMQHMKSDHKLEMQETIRRYSCIYCLFWDKELSVTRTHVSVVHPGELPFLCNHNSSAATEDSLHSLELTDLSEPVTCTEITKETKPSTEITMETTPQTNNLTDIKPSTEELIRCLTENIKIRLRKLTEKTGVPPNYLYRCPESSCGGFFSIYDLWLRHMKLRHRCMEISCPHCPGRTVKTLEEFKCHFEEHRRHTYICLHCHLTLARSEQAEDHWSQEHAELGQLKMEQIRFNLNYSYYILTKSNQFPNQQEFLTSLCIVVDNRLKDLEQKEAFKLKCKWLVTTGPKSLWLEDYPKHSLSPQLVKKCFISNCNFRTKCDETLFTHIRTNHVIRGSIFKCSKCDFRLENSDDWDQALNHTKQHSETSFFICGACSKYFLCRSKISDHIRAEHAARDVPIVNLLKNNLNVYARIAFVFANECLAFSTMHNCFCCEERNMKGHAFMLHLRRYHNFVLNYFCEWCNLPINSLQSVQSHFNERHMINKLKIRCELASKANLTILSVRELKIQIDEAVKERVSSISAVKQEPSDSNDDSVILVEDDDILAENYEKTQKDNAEKTDKPKLKCIAMESLVDGNVQKQKSGQNITSLRILPRIKIVRNSNSTNSIDSFNIVTCSTNNTSSNTNDSYSVSSCSTISPPSVSSQCIMRSTSFPNTFPASQIITPQSSLENIQINQRAQISPAFPTHHQIDNQSQMQSLIVPSSNPHINNASSMPTNNVENTGLANGQNPFGNNVSRTYLPTSGSHVLIPARSTGAQAPSSQITSYPQHIHSPHQPSTSQHLTVTNISHSSGVSGHTINPNINMQLSAFGKY